MKRTGKKLSELVAPLMRYHHSGEINFSVNDKTGLFSSLKEKYAASAADVLEIDGLRYDFPDWWFNVRASNTEPVVRLNLEAKTAAEREEKIKEISELIAKF
jgi:phosphomannomutase